MLAALPEDKAAGLRDRAREGISKYETGPGQLDIPGVSLIASGVRTED
jgi:hypothetical protein